MKKFILFIIFCGLSVSFGNAQEEYKISFSYDTAGNQTLRDRVCINCNSAKTPVDSTAVAALDEKLDELKENEETTQNSSIIAYPNPVTDVLQVEWETTDNAIKKIMIFSGIGRRLQSKNIRSKDSGINLNFSNYPPGSYFVMVLYADKTKQSLQVIKN
jgi:hypothetical protein